MSALFVSFLLCAFAFTQEKALRAAEGKASPICSSAARGIQSPDHATDVGLPCNFCHTGVDKGDEATIPSVDFCLKCHRTIKADSPEVAKLRDASEKGKEIAWVPVYTVPDFVFFGHCDAHQGRAEMCRVSWTGGDARRAAERSLDQHELLS